MTRLSHLLEWIRKENPNMSFEGVFLTSCVLPYPLLFSLSLQSPTITYCLLLSLLQLFLLPSYFFDTIERHLCEHCSEICHCNELFLFVFVLFLCSTHLLSPLFCFVSLFCIFCFKNFLPVFFVLLIFSSNPSLLICFLLFWYFSALFLCFPLFYFYCFPDISWFVNVCFD